VNGEIEEEGQEEGSQAKGNKEGGSGCFSTCNHIRRSSGEHNDILGLRADGSTSYFCYVEIAPYRPREGSPGSISSGRQSATQRILSQEASITRSPGFWGCGLPLALRVSIWS